MIFNRRLKKELEDANYWKNYYRNRYEEFEITNEKNMKKLNDYINKYNETIKKLDRIQAENDIYKEYCNLKEEPNDEIKEKIFTNVKIRELKEQLEFTQRFAIMASFYNRPVNVSPLVYNPLCPPAYFYQVEEFKND